MTTTPPARKPIHWPSLLMLGVAMLGIMVFLGIAGTGFVGGVLSLFSTMVDQVDAPQLFSYSVGGLFLSVLLMPSVVMGIRRLSGRSETGKTTIWRRIFQTLHPKKLIFLYPFVILLGWLITPVSAINWLFMPFLNMLALSLPAAWLMWIGTRNFEPRAAQRKWGALGLGLTIGPGVIIVLELVAMVLGIVAILVGVALLPADQIAPLKALGELLERISTSGEITDQGVVLLLQNPLVVTMLLVFISGIVPVVEEIFKPVAVWAMWGRPLTPQDGWTLGLLSGAGFALLENFGNVSVGEGWTFIALARGGATALHMFNTALIGYTFVLARQKRRVLPPILALAAAILIHAVWNGMTVFATVSSLDAPTSTGVWPLGFVMAMVLISFALMLGIALVNRRLAQSAEHTSTFETDAANPPEDVSLERIEKE